MKAVLVTEDNYRKLAQRYELPDLELKGSIGWWLVAPFGQDARPEGFLTRTQLLEKFDLDGSIKNGWYNLKEKPPALRDFYLLDQNGDPQKVTEEEYFHPAEGWSNHMNPVVVDYEAGNFKHVHWTISFDGVVTPTNPGCIHFIAKVDDNVIFDKFSNSTEENMVWIEAWTQYMIDNDLGMPT